MGFFVPAIARRVHSECLDVLIDNKKGIADHGEFPDYGEVRRGRGVQLYQPVYRRSRDEDPTLAGGAQHARTGAVRTAARCRAQARMLERWELEESWLVVGAASMRALAFTRTNVRAGEKTVGSMVIFQAVAVREATPEERKQLQEARKAQKIQAKQRRAQRQAEKQAASEAATRRGGRRRQRTRHPADSAEGSGCPQSMK